MVITLDKTFTIEQVKEAFSLYLDYVCTEDYYDVDWCNLEQEFNEFMYKYYPGMELYSVSLIVDDPRYDFEKGRLSDKEYMKKYNTNERYYIEPTKCVDTIVIDRKVFNKQVADIDCDKKNNGFYHSYKKVDISSHGRVQIYNDEELFEKLKKCKL